MKRVGRVPLWPDFLPASYPDRVIAILQGSTIILETGEHFTVDTFSSLLEILYDKNLMVFLSSLNDVNLFPYLDDCIMHSSCDVASDKEGHAISIRFHQKRGSRWVIPVSTWNTIIDESFFTRMRSVYTHCGVGVKSTPTALGKTILKKKWKEYNLRVHTAPNRLCQEFLAKSRIGGRADIFCKKNTFFPELIEIDMSSAYLAHFLKLPTGTPRIRIGSDLWNAVTFKARCTVTIPFTLALGPFPLKKKGHATISYPTQPGTYELTLWREQVEDCLALGCNVELHNGFGWDIFTDDTMYGARELYKLRLSSPTKFVEDTMKKAIVACIGSFGMHNTYYQLVPEEEANEKDVYALGTDNHALCYMIHETHEYNKPAMTHWFDYTLMQCSRSLFWYAYPYAVDGRLVMTNYDSLLVIEGDETTQYYEKHSLAAKMCEMGDLRWQRLTNVTILGSRSLKCDQKETIPGKKRSA